MNDDELFALLRSELVAAARRRYRRRRFPRLGAAAAAVLVGLVCVVALQSGDAHAAVEVIRGNAYVEVRLVDLESRPEEIEAAAAEAGIDLRLTGVPVGPSMVGKFVSLSGTALPDEVIPLDPAAAADGDAVLYSGFRLRDGFDGTLRIALGRPARPGEDWVATSDASAPGELLACEDLTGLSTAEVARRLDGVDARVRWFAIDRGFAGEVFDGLDLYEDWRVVRVLGSGPGELIVEVAPVGFDPYPGLDTSRPAEGC